METKMIKHDERAGRNPTSTGAAAAAIAFEPAVERNTAESAIEHDKIALLAYSYWEARGCPHGSPEEDWLRAESDLRQKATA